MKLKITRDKAYVGAAMPYRVYIDGEEKCMLLLGQTVVLDVPEKKITLKVSMAGMMIHKIEAEAIIYPENCKDGIVNCTIKTKANFKGIFSLGLGKAPGKPEIIVEYHKEVF